MKMRSSYCLLAITACLVFPTVGRVGPADAAEIVSVKKIWDAGKHNAFTDLIRWQEHWWCTFREANGHVGGEGKVRVLTSDDGEQWESIALLAEAGIDLRDPKFSITPDDRLMIVAGGSVYEGTTLKGRQPRVAFSEDGRRWTPTERVLAEGDWLWRVTWHEGACYGVAYDASKRSTPAAQEAAKSSTPAEPGAADWKLRLYQSADGRTFDLVTHLDVPGHPNETTLRFRHDGTMMALARREGGNKNGWIGASRSPYKEWKWTESTMRFGGPNFIELPSGDLWAVTRNYLPKPHTDLAKLTETSIEPVLSFPSGGDTSYAGLAWHENLLWVSYYSSHEGKTAIYLAKVKLEGDQAASRSIAKPPDGT